MSDEEVASLAQRPLADLSNDELALVAERALKIKAEQSMTEYDHSQGLALQHLREVIADALNESPQPPAEA